MTEVEQIRKSLGSDDEQARLQAFLMAKEKSLALPRELIRRGLADSSWRVRKEAVDYFLTSTDASRRVSEVITFLHDQENAGLRNAALDILVHMGPLATAELLAELKSPDQDVRKFVLDILGEIRDERAVGAMIACFADDDPNVRTAAVENLGKVGSSEAIPALLEAMHEPDFSWRFTILEALARIGEKIPVASLLPFEDDPLLRRPLIDCLGRIGNGEAVPTLIRGMADASRKTREAAVLSLARIAEREEAEVRAALVGLKGEGELEYVAELLESREAEIRNAAVRVLGWAGDPRTAERLLPLLADEALRDEIGAAILACGPDAVCELVRLHLGEDAELDLYLIHLAGAADCRELAEAIAPQMAAPESLHRQVAATALGRIGGIACADHLIAALNDEVQDVRDAAGAALCNLAASWPEEIAGKVAGMVHDPDPAARAEGVRIMAEVGGAESEKLLSAALKDEDVAVRQAAVRSLALRGGEDALPALQLALTDEDAEVRVLAAEALGTGEDERSIQALASALSDEDIWVRAAAVRSLGRLPGERADELLKHALQDPVELVTIVALETLAERDPRPARSEFLHALEHRDEEVVKAALCGLAAVEDRTWLPARVDTLLDHPHWDVRLTFLTFLRAEEALACRERLEQRLLVEGDEAVRRELGELLAGIDKGGKQV